MANLAVPRTHWRLEVDTKEDGIELGAFIRSRVSWINPRHLEVAYIFKLVICY